MDPPDPMPNSEVKRNSADGSVGSPHVRVGHRQALNSFLFFKKDKNKKWKAHTERYEPFSVYKSDVSAYIQ